MLKSFFPVVNERTRVLIVGSMPGTASLNAGQYYAYKHNQFWKMMSAFFSDGNIPENYPDKLNLLLQHSVGLWDTLRACERDGSLDTQIRQAQPNDFPALLAQYSAIRTLLFNGRAAYHYFVKFFGQMPGVTYCVLPSTSPANAGVSYEEKRKQWRGALEQALR